MQSVQKQQSSSSTVELLPRAVSAYRWTLGACSHFRTGMIQTEYGNIFCTLFLTVSKRLKSRTEESESLTMFTVAYWNHFSYIG